MAVLAKYDWIIAIISIAFCFSAFGNGANDVSQFPTTMVKLYAVSPSPIIRYDPWTFTAYL